MALSVPAGMSKVSNAPKRLSGGVRRDCRGASYGGVAGLEVNTLIVRQQAPENAAEPLERR